MVVVYCDLVETCLFNSVVLFLCFSCVWVCLFACLIGLGV